MKKKLASVLLCAVMAASMLTGCGNSGDAAATTLLPTARQMQQPPKLLLKRQQLQTDLYTT